MGAAGEGVRVRRVGFRYGTDSELAAMHLVESDIEAERHPGESAQPLASYIAFAHNLPSQFDDHTWLAETDDGTPVGCAACWSDAAGDARVMESYVYVRKPWRMRGVAWQLTGAVVAEAMHEGRTSLVWSTFDAVPAGEAFSRRVGGAEVRVNRTSELRLGNVDWNLVDAWIDEGPRRSAGYRLDFWEGLFTDEMAEDGATLHHIMQTAPRDDLELGDVVLDATYVAELDRALIESGRERWTVFVRAGDGRCVGGTELFLDPWNPNIALQQNTGIHPDHRGLGLAKWAKALMLVRVRDRRPAVERIRTGNAFSNQPMLAINNALGFELVEVRTEWQRRVRHLWSAMP
jgi:RimJ/RimL family protein N-acetyltransferase